MTSYQHSQYERQVKDSQFIEWATEIRMRAERKSGELLREMADRGERQRPGDNPQGRNSSGALLLPPKLGDLGVTKTQSSRWQKLAALDDAAFEARTAGAKKQAVSSIEPLDNCHERSQRGVPLRPLVRADRPR